MTYLPKDSDSASIPALRLNDDKAHKISISDTTARNTTAFDAATEIVSLYTSVDCYIRFGESDVVATTNDHFFPAGIYYDVSIGGGKVGQSSHVSVIQDSEAGTLYVSEKN